MLNPVISTFSASSLSYFDYNVTFTIATATLGARTLSGWGSGSSWRCSQVAWRQTFVKKRQARKSKMWIKGSRGY
jgi:hypothetical protein